ncbi:hypothetical protein F2Q70_00017533 [Brassica cretica]|uniref:Uncharacterized protein n=1 Tax=Brassica cretica TaxID=69181 RepID=A0A8S9I2D9_BRACR|nr:hypothetical protein F2Q70_00017533 [Brassica cretica]
MLICWSLRSKGGFMSFGILSRSRLPVSPDTEKAETDFAGEGGEVDQAESTFRASMSGNFMGFNVLNSALEASCQEARVFRFKAEEAERQLALLRSEASARNERLAADHAKPSAKQSAEYQQLKEAHELVGDFCECRGSVGTLWRTRESDYTFDSELKSMMDFMGDCTHADLLVPPIEGRIQELWDPIPVSPDTEEAATDCQRRRGSGSA